MSPHADRGDQEEADRIRRLLLRIDRIVDSALDPTADQLARLATLLEAECVIENLGMRLGLVPTPRTRRAGDLKPAWPDRKTGTMDRVALGLADLLDAFIADGVMPDALALALQFEADRMMEIDAAGAT